MTGFADAAGQRVLICDGAMGTMLHSAGSALDRALPELSLSDPKLVATIHESYLSAGAGIIQTNTFGANRLWLGDVSAQPNAGRPRRVGHRRFEFNIDGTYFARYLRRVLHAMQRAGRATARMTGLTFAAALVRDTKTLVDGVVLRAADDDVSTLDPLFAALV